MIQVWFDGSCEPMNPGGTMGAAAIIRTGDLTLARLQAFADPEPTNTNNLAEYTGLLLAIAWLQQQDDLHRKFPVEFISDSQLVINQMFGRWQIKAGPYVRAAHQAKLELAKFEKATGRWVRREDNAEADALSRRVAQ